MALMGDPGRISPVFAIVFDEQRVILEDGTSWPVDTWYDPLAKECTPDRAMACVFKGPYDLWFAIDIRDVHFPAVVH